MATVVKSFNSINRRFVAGAEVTEADDIAPHSFSDFVARGFIASGDLVKASPQPPALGTPTDL